MIGREGEINLLDSLVRTLKQILVYHLASAVIRIVQPFLDVKKEKPLGFAAGKKRVQLSYQDLEQKNQRPNLCSRPPQDTLTAGKQTLLLSCQRWSLSKNI